MKAVVLIFGVASALKANSWQARLDKATFDVDVPPRARVRLFQRALKDPDLQKDVRRAVTAVRTQGMGKGHPKFIDILWPTGTMARADIESLFALRQQVPELLEDVQKQFSENPQSLLKPPSDAPAASAPDPAEALRAAVSLATDQAKQEALREELKDLARRTPKGLETPKYTVTRTLDGPTFLGKPEPIELRKYEEFTVARTSMDGSGFGASSGGTGFNTLAAYLFGKNDKETSMAMTMPVEVASTAAEGGGSSMAFVLPKEYADAPPAPLADSKVTIATVPERLVATKAFGGIVTDGEVARQKAALLAVIADEPSIEAVDESEVSVLQYNSPLTVPWRRRNEVAVVVREVAVPEDEVAEGVVSWYDAGVRL